MIQLTTDKGLSYKVDFAYAPTYDGHFMMQMTDNRTLSVIAAEFDGLQTIHVSDPNVGESDYEGYSVLTSIVRKPFDGVVIQLMKNAAIK